MDIKVKKLVSIEGQDECLGCGVCCSKGGPALHSQDLELVQSGTLPLNSLITIRKGELAYNPLADRVQATKTELVKIKGQGKEWNCFYYDASEKKCSFYENRPHSCKILKCWEPADSLEIIEKDTLKRLDILAQDDPFRKYISEHEEACPIPDLEKFRHQKNELSETFKNDLEKCVNDDLIFRTNVVKAHKISLAEELFYFGRPIFQLLQPLGVKLKESHKGVELIWK